MIYQYLDMLDHPRLRHHLSVFSTRSSLSDVAGMQVRPLPISFPNKRDAKWRKKLLPVGTRGDTETSTSGMWMYLVAIT